MATVQVGVALASLQLPLRKAIQRAAELKVDAVQLDAGGELKPGELSETGLRQIRNWLADYGLRVCALGFPTRRGYNVPEDLDRRVEATRQAMQLAYKLGAPVVINRAGDIPETCAGPDWDLLVEVLSELGRYGERSGARLAMETGSESGSQLAQLIQQLPEGTIGVNLDPGSLIVNGFSAFQAVEQLGPHILHVHATDATCDRARQRGYPVPLGRGSAEFPELIGALEGYGYHGYYTIPRPSADDPGTEVSLAIQYLRSLTRA